MARGQAEPVENRELPEYLVRQLEDPEFRAAWDDAVALEQLLDDLVGFRKEGKLTQRDVARAMSTTQSAVSGIENGTNDPRLSTLQRFARAVGARLEFSLDRPVRQYAVESGPVPWTPSSPGDAERTSVPVRYASAGVSRYECERPVVGGRDLAAVAMASRAA